MAASGGICSGEGGPRATPVIAERFLKTILFVCTANICRSPMAAALMRDRIQKAGLESQVAGPLGGGLCRDGGRASTNATAVLRLRGIDLAGIARRR